jgi:hypothetical protein
MNKPVHGALIHSAWSTLLSTATSAELRAVAKLRYGNS